MKKILTFFIIATLSVVAIYLFLANTNRNLSTLSTNAAPPPTLSVLLSVLSDGSPTFDGPSPSGSSCDAATDLINGSDSCSTNNRVRNGDTIVYKVETSLNGSSDDNVSFSLTVDNNQEFYTIPTQCLLAEVTPLSFLSADKKTLFCNMGVKEEGTSTIVLPSTRVQASALNNAVLTTNVTASADMAVDVMAGPVNIIATSTPKLNLVKALASSVNTVRFDTPNPLTGTGTGRLVYYGIGLVAERGSSGFQSGQTISLLDTPVYTTKAGAEPVSFVLVGCNLNGLGNYTAGTLPYGKAGVRPAAGEINSVQDSGSINCSQAGAGSPINLTLTVGDGSPSHQPTLSSNGTALSINSNYIGTYEFSIWIPLTDITSNSFTGGTNLNVDNTVQYTSVPLSNSGINNYSSAVPSSDPQGDNTVNVNIGAVPVGEVCAGNSTDGSPFTPCGVSKTNINVAAPGQNWGDEHTLARSAYYFDNFARSFTDRYRMGCVKVDTEKVDFVDFNRNGRMHFGMTAPEYRGGYTHEELNRNPFVSFIDPDAPDIETYTIGNGSFFFDENIYEENVFVNAPNQNPNNFDQQFVDGPETSLGYGLKIGYPEIEYATSPNDGTGLATTPGVADTNYYTNMYNEKCLDADADNPSTPGVETWTTYDPNNPPPVGTVTKFRLKYKGYSNSPDMVLNSYLFAFYNFNIKTTANPGSYLSVMSTTASFTDDTYQTVVGVWEGFTGGGAPSGVVLDPSDPAFSANQRHASRVLIVGAVTNIAKSKIPADKTILKPGESTRYSIKSSLAAAAGGPTTVKIIDFLPRGMEYLGNVSYSNTQPGQVITGPVAIANMDNTQNPPVSVPGGTTWEWTISNITPGQELPVIEYDAGILASVTRGNFTNKAVIETVSGAMDVQNPSETAAAYLARRLSTTAVSVVGYGGFHIEKYVETPVIEVNKEITYDLVYANYSSSALGASGPIKMIDIFPWNGDALVPVSDYDGKVRIRSLGQSATGLEEYYYTNAAPGTIVQDPADPSNNLTGGIWCGPSIAACSFPVEEATALQIVSNIPMPVGSAARHVKITLATSGNSAGNIYSNEFSGRVPEINLPVYSNDVMTEVVGGSISGVAWNDANGDGIRTSTESILPNTAVCLIGLGEDFGFYVDPEMLDTGADNLFGTSDDKKLCVVTDVNGNYIFSNLRSGDYEVEVMIPATAVTMPGPDGIRNTADDVAVTSTPVIYPIETYDTDGIATLNTTEVTLADTYDGTNTVMKPNPADPTGPYLDEEVPTLASVSSVTAQDFGYMGYTISGTVYHDANEDGLNTATIGCTVPAYSSECGLAGEIIKLMDGSGNPVLDVLGNPIIAITDSSGNYTFTNVPMGSYQLLETQPSGLTSTTTNTLNVTITNADVLDQDFGEGSGSVSGYVYIDTNNNGIKEGTETGINAVSLTITGTDVRGNTINIPVTTNASGYYELTGLLEGTYQIQENATLPAYMQDGIDTVGSSGGNNSINDILSNVQLVSGGNSQNNNFGEIYAGIISGTIEIDNNNDGIGDTPIQGVSITLTSDIVGSTPIVITTDTNGYYEFVNLPPANYTITETQPIAYTSSTFTADTVITPVSLTTLDWTSTDNDYLELPRAGISGRVFLDTDQDSTMDVSEVGIQNVTVELYANATCTGAASTTTQTNLNGEYFFADQPVGSYCIKEVQPTGYGESLESDNIIPITLTTSTSTNNNFGDTLGNISGKVYLDKATANSTFDGTDTGLQGIRMELLNSSNTVIQIVYTDVNGNYQFTNVPAGTYTVQETQPTMYASTENGTSQSVTITAGASSPNHNFGEKGGSLSGYLYIDLNKNNIKDGVETGISGQIVSLSNGMTTVTDSNGYYIFNDLPTDNYSITKPNVSGYTNEMPVSGTPFVGDTSTLNQITDILALLPGINGTKYNFGHIPLVNIGGTVWYDKDRDGIKDETTNVEGVTVELYNNAACTGTPITSTTTDINGAYVFANQEIGTYCIKEIQPTGYGDSTSNTLTLNITTDTDSMNNNFGDTLSTISGRVYADDDMNDAYTPTDRPLVTVVTITGPVTVSVTTNPDGTYKIEDLPSGDYTITETQVPNYHDGIDTVGSLGGVWDDPDSIMVTIPTNADGINYNFGEIPLEDISGTVWFDSNYDGIMDETTYIAGVTIELLDSTGKVVSTTTTDANGDYIFKNVEIGTYTVRETQPTGYGSSTPNSVQVILKDNEPKTIDFGETKKASISGSVYIDLDNDGVRDANELGIEGSTVTLTGIDGQGNTVTLTTTTDESGNYIFVVEAGTYTIVETQPSNYADGKDASPTGVVTNDNIASITVEGTDESEDNVFGELGGIVSGYTYIDTNQNGVKDTGEEILPNLSVVIVCNDYSITVMSDDMGYYEVSGLPLGECTITEVMPEGYVMTSTNPLTVTLTTTELSFTEQNFGQIQTSDITVNIYGDANQNKTKDSGEVNMRVCTVILKQNGVEVSRAVPDANGNVVFADKPIGSYTVEVSCGEYTVTTGTVLNFTLTSEGIMQYFGVMKPLAKTGYQLWW